jgi:hypothetical protein
MTIMCNIISNISISNNNNFSLQINLEISKYQNQSFEDIKLNTKD